MALHALLAGLLVSRIAPQEAESPTMTVTLVRLPPRARPPAPPPTPTSARATVASPAAAPHPSRTAARQADSRIDWRVRPSEGVVAENAPAALRGKLGCRHADLLALTKAERTACHEALAKGSETAPTYAVVSPKLEKAFDGTFECPKGDVWCEYRIGKAPYPGLLAPRKPPRDKSWDGN